MSFAPIRNRRGPFDLRLSAYTTPPRTIHGRIESRKPPRWIRGLGREEAEEMISMILSDPREDTKIITVWDTIGEQWVSSYRRTE